MQAYRLRGWNDGWAGRTARLLEQPYDPNESELWQAGWTDADEMTDAERDTELGTQLRRTAVGLPTYQPYIIVEPVDQL